MSERLSDEEIDATLAMLNTGHCKDGYGCNALTVCACATMEDAAEAITKLRAELTAARTVADGEVAKAVDVLASFGFGPGETEASTSLGRVADLLLRLSAAKAEAEARASTWQSAAEMRETQLDDLANQHRAQIEAIEKEHRRDIIKLGGERDEAREALGRLVSEYDDDGEHGIHAYEQECPLCCAIEDARNLVAALKPTPTPDR